MTTKSETMDAVVLERTFNAPVARIWRALTTVEELRAWYFCDAVALAYTWRFKAEPGNSPVTWELAAEGDRTGVKVTHTGIETFPKTPAYARKNFETGWTQVVGSELKQFVEKSKKGQS